MNIVPEAEPRTGFRARSSAEEAGGGGRVVSSQEGSLERRS